MNTQRKTEFSYAFRQTIPVMLGYLFLGIAFGLMLQEAGYNFLWALLISTVVYAGSMQFMLVTFLTGGVSLLSAAVMTLFINGRHLFYGLTFVERFIGFDSTGIDFSMSALFIVIMVEQWQGAKSHFPAILGMVSGIVWLVLLGPDRFILPALCTCVLILLLKRERNSQQGKDEVSENSVRTGGEER